MKYVIFLFLFFCVIKAYGQGDVTTAAEIHSIASYNYQPTKQIFPTSFSLKKFCPAPGNQYMLSTCVAWSLSYARTISYTLLRGMTNRDTIASFLFSPGFLYCNIKAPDDVDCRKGASIKKAIDFLISKGIIPASIRIDSCAASIPDSLFMIAKPFRLKSQKRLSDSSNKITDATIMKIKSALLDLQPVLVSMKYFNSFVNLQSDGVWRPDPYEIYDTIKKPAHAMCIVGYDDSLKRFEVINSWGAEWGNKGYGWIRYDQLKKYGRYAVNIVDYTNKTESINCRMDLKLFDDNSKLKVVGSEDKYLANNPAIFEYKATDQFPTAFNLKMLLSSTSSGFIYMFRLPENGLVSQLNLSRSPELPATSKAGAIDLFAGRKITVEKDSTERILVVFSKRPFNVSDFLAYINEPGQPVKMKIPLYFAKENFSFNPGVFGKNNIEFRSRLASHSVFCFTIEI